MNAGYKWPQYSIHRGKLLSLLHNAVIERLGKDRIHTGHKVIDCGSNDGGAWAKFELRNNDVGSSANKVVIADVVVGCDGIHSKVREALVEPQPPRWTGITMLRGLTKMKPFLDGRTMTIIGPVQREVVVYPISKEVEDEDPNEALVNWVALVKTEEYDLNMLEQWNVEVEDLDEAMKPFEDFKYDFLDVPTMIRSAEKVYQYPMIDRV
mmetsp:Transcript_15202/g.21517  ORF Transcript_15202/g.21517 Transcript_15202/m.21517 type:complete len:209 (+) Transcript_15202:65-691(+)